jgi:hypothetical protein
MVMEIFLYVIFITPSALCIGTMLFLPFFMTELKFFVPAWFDFSVKQFMDFG